VAALVPLRRRDGKALAIAGAAALAVAVSVPALSLPWWGDQALFACGARALSGGARLYLDFWDNKQPGVYWFFWVGGELFGSFGLGPRLLELLWLALGAGLAAGALRRAGGGWLAAALTPSATLAAYYVTAEPAVLTQVESLVALPLVGCVWLAMRWEAADVRRRRTLAVAFGLCAGTVALFKLVLLPIPAALWLATLALHGSRWRESAGATLWVVGGGGAVLAAVLAVFAWQGTLEQALWTALAYPRLAMGADFHAPLERLVRSALSFAGSIAFLLPAAAWGLLAAWRRGPAARRLSVLLLVWEAAAVLAIGLQRFSWWRYHFTLLLWPLGMLAVLAVVDLAARAASATAAQRTRWRVGLAAAVVCALVPVGLGAVRTLGQAAAAAAPLRIEALPVQASSAAAEAIAALPGEVRATGACPGPYVFGDPAIALAAERPAALATHGWAWEFYLDSQWARLRADLRAATPTAVYLDPFFRRVIEQKAPEVLEDLAARYRVVWQGHDGAAWLTRPRDGRPCASAVPFSVPGEGGAVVRAVRSGR